MSVLRILVNLEHFVIKKVRCLVFGDLKYKLVGRARRDEFV